VGRHHTRFDYNLTCMPHTVDEPGRESAISVASQAAQAVRDRTDLLMPVWKYTASKESRHLIVPADTYSTSLTPALKMKAMEIGAECPEQPEQRRIHSSDC